MSNTQIKSIEICKRIMIQGTASSAGKSLIVSALCRIFHQDGYHVAPFKAQNMSNNSFVTFDGLEMGRAQVVQAFAAGCEPDVRMNPVLLKPSSDTGSQVVMNGKPSFNLNAKDWHATREVLRSVVRENYKSLEGEYEIIVIEGAGSPAEINLKKNDIVNMGMAHMADAPVIIVGDIDRGGVFASLVGTMALLDPDEKKRVRGFLINKFRGDLALLESGLRQLEEITDVPVIGVIPWITHTIDEEDGVSERFEHKENTNSELDICIVKLPHISNYTDFIPLELIPGVKVRWCDKASEIENPDLLIIPGTKATIADMKVLKKSGIVDSIRKFVQKKGLVLGVCGGFQMLGTTIFDPMHVESIHDCEDGLGVLEMTTTFSDDKQTVQVSASIHSKHVPIFESIDSEVIHGYEIHMGKSSYGASTVPFMTSDTDGRVLGVTDKSGTIIGTYLHGLFDTAKFTKDFINALRKRKGLEELQNDIADRKIAMNKDIDILAQTVRESIDLKKLYSIMNINDVDD